MEGAPGWRTSLTHHCFVNGHRLAFFFPNVLWYGVSSSVIPKVTIFFEDIARLINWKQAFFFCFLFFFPPPQFCNKTSLDVIDDVWRFQTEGSSGRKKEEKMGVIHSAQHNRAEGSRKRSYHQLSASALTCAWVRLVCVTGFVILQTLWLFPQSDWGGISVSTGTRKRTVDGQQPGSLQ